MTVGPLNAVPSVFDDAFRMAMVVCSVLLATGAAVSWLTIRNPLDGVADED